MPVNKKSIVKVWFSKPREAWYSLSEKEQKDFFKKEQEMAKKLRAKFGIKTINTSKSLWSNEEWFEFGMEEFPNIEAVQEYNEQLSKLGMYKYFEAKVLLGTPIE